MNRRALVLVAAAGLLSLPVKPVPVEAASVSLTYYLPTGNRTASGEWPHQGSAACSYQWPFGTILEFEDGWQVVCLDRGMLGHSHIDVFVLSHAEGRYLIGKYGTTTDISVARWGW